MDKSIIVDIEKCLACKSCEIACALAHSRSKILSEAIQESPKPQRMMAVEAAGEYGVPIQCRHCESAPCIEICPTGAIHREDEQSPVVVEADLCIGCKLCMLVCPFGVLRIGKEGRAIIKCDMCYERLKEGMVPECVEACPTGAIKLVSLEEVTKSRRKEASGEIVRESGSGKSRQGKAKRVKGGK